MKAILSIPLRVKPDLTGQSTCVLLAFAGVTSSALWVLVLTAIYA